MKNNLYKFCIVYTSLLLLGKTTVDTTNLYDCCQYVHVALIHCVCVIGKDVSESISMHSSWNA